jgi:protein TonB
MTTSEILKADVLDILFENRNKDYGAYALRRGYNNRLFLALALGISVILVFVLVNVVTTKKAVTKNDNRLQRDELVIRTVQLPKDQPKQPEKPKEIAKPKAIPKVAQVKFTNPKITEDTKVKEPLPPVDDLSGKQTSTQNTAGIPDDGKVKLLEKPVENTGNGHAGPTQPISEFIVQERDPEFPGGAEALKKFLSRYLATPDVLEEGEKKVVKIRFKVDKDGTVNTFEIVTSGGDEFDSEVLRVVKKMPRWIPAVQNGINVPVSYVLPVTFMGME